MGIGFRGTVRKAYPMGSNRALVMHEGYEGDADVGDHLEVTPPGGEAAQGKVESLAWGSAFRADSPPLTLVVSGLEGAEALEGAEVRTVSR